LNSGPFYSNPESAETREGVRIGLLDFFFLRARLPSSVEGGHTCFQHPYEFIPASLRIFLLAKAIIANRNVLKDL
jgi:hypothetical protein